MRLVVASFALLMGAYGATAVAQATKQSDIRVNQKPWGSVPLFTHFEPLLPECGHLNPPRRTGPSSSKRAPSLLIFPHGIYCGVVPSLPWNGKRH
jgi:hypothetical protein